MNVIEIETVWPRVELEEAAALQCSFHHALDVQLAGVAPVYESACGMSQEVEVGVVHRPDHAFGLRVSGEVEAVVDRANREVEVLEHALRQGERSVLQDVHLSRLEKDDTAELLVQPVDLLDGGRGSARQPPTRPSYGR